MLHNSGPLTRTGQLDYRILRMTPYLPKVVHYQMLFHVRLAWGGVLHGWNHYGRCLPWRWTERLTPLLLPDYTASQPTRHQSPNIIILCYSTTTVNCHRYIRLVTHQCVCSSVQTIVQLKNKTLSHCHLAKQWCRVEAESSHCVASDQLAESRTSLSFSLALKVSRLEPPFIIRRVQNISCLRMCSKPQLQWRIRPSSPSLGKQKHTRGANKTWSNANRTWAIHYDSFAIPPTNTGAMFLNVTTCKFSAKFCVSTF